MASDEQKRFWRGLASNSDDFIDTFSDLFGTAMDRIHKEARSRQHAPDPGDGWAATVPVPEEICGPGVTLTIKVARSVRPEA